MKKKPEFQIVKSCRISELKEGDCVLDHGRVFRLRDRWHNPDDNFHHPNGVFSFKTDDLGNQGGGFSQEGTNIPLHWVKEWTIQSNDLAWWEVVELELED
jgi:hypothetical protein